MHFTRKVGNQAMEDAINTPKNTPSANRHSPPSPYKLDPAISRRSWGSFRLDQDKESIATDGRIGPWLRSTPGLCEPCYYFQASPAVAVGDIFEGLEVPPSYSVDWSLAEMLVISFAETWEREVNDVEELKSWRLRDGTVFD
jgi:hypothetical protein